MNVCEIFILKELISTASKLLHFVRIIINSGVKTGFTKNFDIQVTLKIPADIEGLIKRFILCSMRYFVHIAFEISKFYICSIVSFCPNKSFS